MTQARDEITALREYESFEEYRQVQAAVAKDPMHEQAQTRRKELEPLYVESREEFLESTGSYSVPRQIVAVCGYITNDTGETLLVRTNWRDDTWEVPGGQVEQGEALHMAAEREVMEETVTESGVTGVAGVYQNVADRRGCRCPRCGIQMYDRVQVASTMQAGFLPRLGMGEIALV